MNPKNIKIAKGTPLPFGATRDTEGINFALVSKIATAVTLNLYDLEEKVFKEICLDPRIHKTGDVWHIYVEEKENKLLGYTYKINLPPLEVLKQKMDFFPLLDPYAKAVHTTSTWGALCCGDLKNYQPIGLVTSSSPFDWQGDAPLKIPAKDLIIYEMHTRGFTQDRSSQVKARGTFLGVIEKIPHLLELGINAVELMPMQEFNECEYKIQNPHIHENLYQYWGYSTVNFFAPMNRYAFSSKPGDVINEFKTMVRELHKNGIEVILDIVLNHTNEGNENGPIDSFKGIDPCIYYILDSQGRFMNFTGCGNTINANNPIVQQFILDVLQYWVLEMHVDGFRFDLASIFYRGSQGEVLNRPPIVEAISKDPILAETLLISEPWDASGLYQVGSFYPQGNRWMEWNARYRDTTRRFIKGNPNLNARFASRLSGSQDIYGNGSPSSSLNFIVSHDGFTLHDLVSYNQKHNLMNGENNRDGLNENDSWNCGKEGTTNDKEVTKLRERQMRNFHLALMLSQGVPMLLMGDEYAHTKKGNNNTWCHDNPLNWFHWDKLKKNQDFYRFYRKLIEFRKKHEVLHQGRFLTPEDVSWWGKDGNAMIWEQDTHFLAFSLHDSQKNETLYAAFNTQDKSLNINLPLALNKEKWNLLVNTANDSPFDLIEEGKKLDNHQIFMLSYSAILLKA